MEKIKLNIIGLTYSQSQSGAYALMLAEENGKRRLPIIIGANEAQSIAIELEKMTPNRPLTHDLFKSFAQTFSIQVKEILIYNLVEGIFFAKLICQLNDEIAEIDARTSDAIAIAVRFDAPIYSYEFILGSAGIFLDEDGEGVQEKPKEEPVAKEKKVSKKSIKELEKLLDEALKKEDYEKASKLRDEINHRKDKSN